MCFVRRPPDRDWTPERKEAWERLQDAWERDEGIDEAEEAYEATLPD